MTQTALDIALSYIERGWNPVPIPHKAKGPSGVGWQNRHIDAASAPRFFDGTPLNIGIILGPTSNGLTDVDLDCREAIAIAPYTLPKTNAIFGRASKRFSHWLYCTDLAVTTERATIQLKDPRTKAMLLELRIGGESGAQTVFPGSTHESGELITWEENGEPDSVMREMFGQDVADRIAEWLDYRGGDERSAADPTPQTESPRKQADSGALKSARASTFELSAIQWVWPNRFAAGKLGLLVGLPDEGKGQIFCDIAARITTPGSEWPCSEGVAPFGNVLLLTAEDDISDTVVPRLKSAGADLDRVEIVRMVREANKDRMFSLITDLPLLRQKIVEIGNVVMVQIDPISAYLGVGKIDSFRTTDVRAVLGPVTEFASELKVSVLGIMHFNKKTDVTNALLRISDSLAFGATARHVYAVIDDAENKRKLFVKAKNNLAPRDTKALAYNFGAREVGTDPKTDEPIWAPHIVWHNQYVDVTATEAMQAATETKSPAARDEAKKFLETFLADGPKLKSEIEDAAEANCVSERTLARAKAELGIIAKKDGLKGGWKWQLPAEKRRWNDD
jgi:hypothetical protein